MPRIKSAKPTYRSTKEKTTDDSFRSVSTDPNLTDYDLEYTTRLGRSSRGRASTTPRSRGRSQYESESSDESQENYRQGSRREDLTASVTTRSRQSASIRSEVPSTSRSRQRAPAEAPSTSRSRQRAPAEAPSTSRSRQRAPAEVPSTSRSRPGPSQSRVKPPFRAPLVRKDQELRRTVTHEEGSAALREIRHLQRFEGTLIPKLPFSKLVREILHSFGDLRLTKEALNAIQESAELYMTQFFEDSYICTMHRGRVTLMPRDMKLVRYLRGYMLRT